jgi:hypothetical protein
MPVTINGGSTATYFKGWDSFQNPTAYTVPYTTTSGGTTTTTTIKDATKAEVTTLNAFVNNTVFCSQPVTSVVNNTPTICDTTTFPNVVTLANGTGQVTLNTNNGALASTFTCSVAETFANSYISGYTNGSLTKTINDLVVGAVNGRPVPLASFMNVYSVGNLKNPDQYTKNIIDLSPFSENGSGRAVTLVSPRHVTSVSHFPIGLGATLVFRDKDGVAQTRTVVNEAFVFGDNWVGYLDSAVTGITPYSVLPANATTTTKIPLASENTGAYGTLPLGIYGFTVKKRTPFGGGDYIRQVQLGVDYNISGSLNTKTLNNSGAGVLIFSIAITNINDVRYPYTNWHTNIIIEDSGSPTFLPTGLTTATGTPLTLLLGAQSTGAVATSLSYYIPEINSAMNAIKDIGDTTVYALDQINISQSAWWNSFTSY